jgi:hypothetical protein
VATPVVRIPTGGQGRGPRSCIHARMHACCMSVSCVASACVGSLFVIGVCLHILSSSPSPPRPLHLIPPHAPDYNTTHYTHYTHYTFTSVPFPVCERNCLPSRGPSAIYISLVIHPLPVWSSFRASSLESTSTHHMPCHHAHITCWHYWTFTTDIIYRLERQSRGSQLLPNHFSPIPHLTDPFSFHTHTHMYTSRWLEWARYHLDKTGDAVYRSDVSDDHLPHGV